MNELYPLFTIGTEGNLDPSRELLTIAAKLGVAYIIIVGEPKPNHA